MKRHEVEVMTSRERKRLDKVEPSVGFKLPTAAWYKKNHDLVNTLIAAAGYRIKVPSPEILARLKRCRKRTQ